MIFLLTVRREADHEKISYRDAAILNIFFVTPKKTYPDNSKPSVGRIAQR